MSITRTRMLQRRGTEAEWTAANPILGNGEIGVSFRPDGTTDFKVGNGSTRWNELNFHLTDRTLFEDYQDQGLRLEGVSANDTAHITNANLLDADSAHLHQSMGQWVNFGWGSSRVLASDVKLFGDHSLEIKPNQTTVDAWPERNFGASTTTNTTDHRPAEPGQTYSFSCNALSRDVSTGLTLQIIYRNSSGITVHTAQDAKVVKPDDGWVGFSVTGTAPANTVFVQFAVTTRNDLSEAEPFDANSRLNFDRFCVRSGSNGSFIPSIRVVSDLEIRWDGFLDDWLNPPHQDGQPLIANGYGTGSFWFLARSDSRLQLGLRLANNNNYFPTSSSIIPFVNGKLNRIRATRKLSTGQVRYFHTVGDSENWFESLAAAPAPGTKIANYSSNVSIGSGGSALRVKGLINHVEIRDGIGANGLTVASFNPGKSGLWQPGDTSPQVRLSPEGQTITLSGSARILDSILSLSRAGYKYSIPGAARTTI